MKCVTDRRNLAEEIPLAVPFAPMIEMSSYCNFACEFCPVSKKEDIKGTNFVRHHMEPELFKTIIDQLNEFPIIEGYPFKLYLNGGSESSTHPQFVELIQYATSKLKHRANSFIIRTNGSLLTPDVSDKIIEAGMTEINISIEAVNGKGYEKVTHRKGMFQRVLDNVTYLYNHRGNCRIYTKIIPLGTPETDKEEFFRIFGPISNMIDIELPMFWSGSKRDVTLGKGIPERTVNDDPITPNVACPYIFYTLMISSMGLIHNCCFDIFDYIDNGNVHENTLQELWGKGKMLEFWKLHLEGRRMEHPICSKCQYVYGCPDFLSEEDRKNILERLK